MVLSTECPLCGSFNAHISRYRGFGERLRALVGTYPLRCGTCGQRFARNIWRSAGFRFAKCPKCYRVELSTWSEQYYDSDIWTTVKLRFGATPYRCEYCRCNFASFRPCKERFSWRKRVSKISVPASGSSAEGKR